MFFEWIAFFQVPVQLQHTYLNEVDTLPYKSMNFLNESIYFWCLCSLEHTGKGLLTNTWINPSCFEPKI